MTLIELIVILFFIGGGAVGGANVASVVAPGDRWVGPIIGALAGAGLLWLLSHLMSRSHPPCRCGVTREQDFRFVEDPEQGYVDQCACGRRYLMRSGRRWLEVLPREPPRFYLTRDFWGRWR